MSRAYKRNTDPPSTPSTWLTVREAAHEVRFTERGIRELIAAGKLPAYRVAGTRPLRIRRDDLDAIVEPTR